MTTKNQTEVPATVFDIDALLKQHAAPFNAKIAELLGQYRVSKEEAGNALENKQRFERAGAASRAAAEANNLEIRTVLRQREFGSKEAHKKRAERAGNLADAEIYESMVKEADVSIAGANLRSSRPAGEIVRLSRQARSAVHGLLSELIASRVNDEFRAIAVFVNLVAEIAERGDSAFYNARSDIFSPMDFAIAELAKVIGAGLGARDQKMGSNIFIAETPAGLARSVLSPLTAQKMEAEILAMEATL